MLRSEEDFGIIWTIKDVNQQSGLLAAKRSPNYLLPSCQVAALPGSAPEIEDWITPRGCYGYRALQIWPLMQVTILPRAFPVMFVA